VIIYRSQGERGTNLQALCPSLVEIGASGVNDLSCAGSKKNVKNPLTKTPKYDTMDSSKRERK
jgi:hypothetical protein